MQGEDTAAAHTSRCRFGHLSVEGVGHGGDGHAQPAAQGTRLRREHLHNITLGMLSIYLRFAYFFAFQERKKPMARDAWPRQPAAGRQGPPPGRGLQAHGYQY